MPSIDQYSLAAILIEMLFDRLKLGVGTAFIWRADEVHWLITTWRNVSGRDPKTGQHLSPTAAEPDRLKVLFNARARLGDKLSKYVNVRSDAGAPLWLVHPTYGQKVDVVAVPLQNYDDVDMYAINTLPSDDLVIQVGMDVFVLGFPFGIATAGFPIWKRGSIASEPQLTLPPHQHLLIDTASRPGMSGSPVIRRTWGNITTATGNTVVGSNATKLIGVYSCLLGVRDHLDTQMGLTWPASLVPEIISGGRVDR
jgi:trypsin-like peptidase